MNVVGLSTTRTPLDSSHSVIPSASFVVVFAIVPGAGSGSSSGRASTVSTYAVSGAPLAALMAAASLASSGIVTPGLLRRADDDDAVAIGHPVLGQAR